MTVPGGRKGKRKVVGELVCKLRADKSSRFLTKDDCDWWVEAPEKELHDKVMKSFSHASLVARKKSTPFQHPITEDNESSSGKRKRPEPKMDGDIVRNKRYLNHECSVLNVDWCRGLGCGT